LRAVPRHRLAAPQARHNVKELPGPLVTLILLFR
jgi:hypothetical protein